MKATTVFTMRLPLLQSDRYTYVRLEPVRRWLRENVAIRFSSWWYDQPMDKPHYMDLMIEAIDTTQTRMSLRQIAKSYQTRFSYVPITISIRPETIIVGVDE